MVYLLPPRNPRLRSDTSRVHCELLDIACEHARIVARIGETVTSAALDERRDAFAEGVGANLTRAESRRPELVSFRAATSTAVWSALPAAA
jgi:hypothetical protein